MATFKKNGKKWVAEVRCKGVYRSKTCGTKAEAQQWALDFEQQIGRNPGMATSRTLRDAFKKYAAEVTPMRKGARWEEIRLAKFERDPIASLMLTNITHDDIEAWIGRQTTGPGSINRELNLFSGVFREARVRWKWMAHNPMPDVKRPKQPPGRDRLIVPQETARVLLALEYDETGHVATRRQKIAVAYLLALETAMRHGEIWGLDWELIFLERRFLTLLDTKNGSKRDVALSDRAVELLQKLGPKTIGRVIDIPQASSEVIFRRGVALAGINNLHFHDTRHTAITRLARKLDVLDLARMVGHKDLRSLMTYYNATAEDVASRLNASPEAPKP